MPPTQQQSGLSLEEINTAISIGQSLLQRNTQLQAELEALEELNAQFTCKITTLESGLRQEQARTRQLLTKQQHLEEQLCKMEQLSKCQSAKNSPNDLMLGSGSGNCKEKVPGLEVESEEEIVRLHALVQRQQQEIDALRTQLQANVLMDEREVASKPTKVQIQGFKVRNRWWRLNRPHFYSVTLVLEECGASLTVREAKKIVKMNGYTVISAGAPGQHVSLPSECAIALGQTEAVEVKIGWNGKIYTFLVQAKDAILFGAGPQN